MTRTVFHWAAAIGSVITLGLIGALVTGAVLWARDTYGKPKGPGR